MSFNENTRVKIPAILHLCRLGYKYLSLKNYVKDLNTNIFMDIFDESIKRINSDKTDIDTKKIFEDISLCLDNDDLGKEFYKKLTAVSGIKLIDFNNFNNNSFNVVTELEYENDEDIFRPDITILINGMPLAFIEVKKPNNHEGILAERDRINIRFKNKKFKKFINITQLLVFSNNMEYDVESIEPVQGAFYSTTSLNEANFNCFKEELVLNTELEEENDVIENLVLKDNNLIAIKYSPEFITNKELNTPTNRIITSLFCKERFAFFLKYSIAYVKESKGIEKHIMRYPQVFATMAIQNKIDAGIKKGIIWHTQGSGKTALSCYNVPCLTDYFQKKGIIPKFYFIVDRIDLMNQAKREFTIRGLTVHTVNSKEDLLKNFHLKQAIHNLTGKSEITVVNIQKFKDDTDVLRASDYDINIQRVYFLDEVHRSYNPTGSFLANLFNSDRNAILIGLTGTPLILSDRKSRDTFGDYIHKYYYNASIADGYTLRLIREGIETNYKIQLEQALKEIEILKGDADKRIIYAHDKFVEPMLDYIVQDFIKSRIRFGDHSIGGMVVCDSSDQARKLFDIFIKKYNPEQKTIEAVDTGYHKAEEPVAEYDMYRKEQKNSLTASLILHDIGSKYDRKQEIEDFKDGKIDLLFVYNMLLTGFDAKRLKKLYIGRLIKDHNLLQMLTRVNRPYKKFKFGFVVDFADIRSEFDKTNKEYFDELQGELGDEMETYSKLFMSKEEIEADIQDIREKLFHYDLTNAEIFSQQISQIEDRKKVLEIKKALENARNLYNIIRLYGHFDLLEKIDFKKLNQLYNETVRHLELLNLKESVQNNVDTTNLLNVALENVLFMFKKVSEEEMIIADQLKDILRKTREALGGNFDQKDPEFVSLYDELKRLFDKKNLDEITQDEMKQNIGALQNIFDKVAELNRKNNLLKARYMNDEKYARVHKRILEKGNITKKELAIFDTLFGIKKLTDEKVLINTKLLENEGYFNNMLMPLVIGGFEKVKVDLDPDTARFINNCVAKEYIKEFHGVYE
ncbi:MAG: type I restriction endonuclease subunit R [Spirochaetes bacterium]|nr:type I restriction endonuclease subunit R [Spirochaetota bacterium]